MLINQVVIQLNLGRKRKKERKSQTAHVKEETSLTVLGTSGLVVVISVTDLKKKKLPAEPFKKRRSGWITKLTPKKLVPVRQQRMGAISGSQGTQSSFLLVGVWFL